MTGEHPAIRAAIMARQIVEADDAAFAAAERSTRLHARAAELDQQLLAFERAERARLTHTDDAHTSVFSDGWGQVRAECDTCDWHLTAGTVGRIDTELAEEAAAMHRRHHRKATS